MVLLISFFASCSDSDEILNENNGNYAKTCLLDFNVSYTDYNATASRAASSTIWKDEDKVYLTFENNAYGVATYKAGEWALKYYGNLTKDKKSICKAVYFSNPKSAEEFQAVNTTHETAIYEDTLASYNFDGSLMSITAILEPQSGRVRFKGEYKDTINVYGLVTKSRYSVYKGEYNDTVQFIQLIVNSDGYTPYIYGGFSDTVNRRLNVATTKSVYTRIFDNTIMNKGESGWLSIPTDSSHIAWQNKMVFRLKTTDFAMVPVTRNNRLSFIIGETEVTKGLYNALTDSVIIESNYPQTFDTHNTANNFVELLNAELGVSFSLPSTSDWEWAYKGGERSQGYKYSGSDNATEIGWFKENSNGKVHEVATLMPNELGIYDMSGNLQEWTSRLQSTSYYYYYKGDYSSDICGISKASSIQPSSKIANIGVRLSLKLW